MSERPADMDAIVAALGGTGEAAKAFGVTAAAVSNWKADGCFPRGRRYEALILLRERGIVAHPSVFGADHGGESTR